MLVQSTPEQHRLHTLAVTALDPLVLHFPDDG